MTRAILTHARYYCDYNYVFDENDLLTSLPAHLQQDIYHCLAKNILKQIDIFKSLNDNILGLLSLKLKSISCNEDHILFHKGSRSKEIYIQRTGKSIIDYHDVRKNKKIFKRGDVFGILALISPKRKTTVTCQTWRCCIYLIYILYIYNLHSFLNFHYVP